MVEGAPGSLAVWDQKTYAPFVLSGSSRHIGPSLPQRYRDCCFPLAFWHYNEPQSLIGKTASSLNLITSRASAVCYAFHAVFVSDTNVLHKVRLSPLIVMGIFLFPLTASEYRDTRPMVVLRGLCQPAILPFLPQSTASACVAGWLSTIQIYTFISGWFYPSCNVLWNDYVDGCDLRDVHHRI